MSEENKKEVKKPRELNEEKSDAHAEAGPCTQTTFSCGIGGMTCRNCGQHGCGLITRSSCGWQANLPS